MSADVALFERCLSEHGPRVAASAADLHAATRERRGATAVLVDAIAGTSRLVNKEEDR